MFVDPKYDEQRQKIADDLDEAIGKAIDIKKSEKIANNNSDEANNLPKTSSTAQTVSETKTATDTKQKAATSSMLKDWMGVGDLDVSSSSSDEEADKAPAKSKPHLYRYNLFPLILVLNLFFILIFRSEKSLKQFMLWMILD